MKRSISALKIHFPPQCAGRYPKAGKGYNRWRSLTAIVTLNGALDMWSRLRDHWVYGGLLAALMLLVLTPFLADGWSLALERWRSRKSAAHFRLCHFFGKLIVSDLVWVYVDTVCDLLHPGHLEFFRKARSLGDRLIVGLNSDEDVSTYKPRPIMTFDERRTMVEACRHVDRVVPTPAPLFCTPEFLDTIGASFCVHGDDMDAKELAHWYGALLPSGRLRVVAYTMGVSSRDLISRVIERYETGTLRIAPKAR